jgi:hypothetical protein
MNAMVIDPMMCVTDVERIGSSIPMLQVTLCGSLKKVDDAGLKKIGQIGTSVNNYRSSKKFCIIHPK